MAEPIRCAIYTRVSDDQGLDLSFNTLHAQYDAAEAYIREPGPRRLDSSARKIR